MTVFHVDLDNTLIYSYKHDIGEKKIAVETYQGREISFVSQNTYAQLQALKNKILIVPTSTRSIEQYKRIDLHIGKITYALVCNGGVLLVNGEKDLSWYKVSKAMMEESLPALEYAHTLLTKDNRRTFELRWIEDLFLFTKCEHSEKVVNELRKILDTKKVNVFCNKEKVYVIPIGLNKGKALQRFREYIHRDKTIAAGDSEFDIPMLEAADIGIVPKSFSSTYSITFPLEEMCGTEIFSDEMLKRVSELFS